MHRQRILERADWVFWRCFASDWYRRKNEMIDDLIQKLSEHCIEPIGFDCAPRSRHTEQRIVLASELKRSEMIAEIDNSSEENISDDEPKAFDPQVFSQEDQSESSAAFDERSSFKGS